MTAESTSATSAHPLVVRSTPVADLPGGLTALLDVLPDTRPLAWVRRGDGIVGWGEALRFEAWGPGRFADAEAAWQDVLAHAVVRDEVGLPGSGPVAFGSFAFDDTAGTSGDARACGTIVVPRVVVGRRGGRTWVTTIDTAGSLTRTPGAHVLRAADREPVTAPGEVTTVDGALSATDWSAVVGEAVERIRDGALDKVVLARDVVATASAPIDPRWLLTRLASAYEACWTFSVDGMVGATPELLVRSEKGLVTSRVLAGTIRRSRAGVSDDDALLRAAQLARSSKDLEEHEYAVASVAEALAPFCSSMNVPDAPFVLHLPNVMHLASDVTGVLAGHAADGGPVAGSVPSSLALAAALHPSAAVCGTPTAAARELIREIEGMDRGRYAAPVGWLGADGDGEWGIALRSAELSERDPRTVRLFAGCGIVAASDPAAELAESEAKLEPMRYALGG
ncbi:isochorismate synthase [Oerskovia flava]|uniref:isochorismate synthase n=1 Tax=Oerskovia flava TaxID=2986422 RepID=UPI00223FFF66|nr:isochorismate synthase [Oerskovia sp. JB1-3-2]